MKENKGIDFKELVKTYYDRYKAYDIAYTNEGDVRANMMNELKETLINEDSKSNKFKNIVKEYMVLHSMHSAEVSHAANRFYMAADMYLLVSNEELDEEMSKAYISLKDNEYKSIFSIANGKFVRNKDVELPQIPQEEFDFLFEYFDKQFSNT